MGWLTAAHDSHEGRFSAIYIVILKEADLPGILLFLSPSQRQRFTYEFVLTGIPSNRCNNRIVYQQVGVQMLIMPEISQVTWLKQR